MASFTALNVEPDDHSDVEVDNTKELQIEEALKLYQNALKLHSQGPAAYAQAAEAYSNLFQSDVFKFPETITEFVRLDQNPELEYSDFFIPLDLAITVGTDGSPNSLPQILFLAYRNHALFILDCLKCRLRNPNIEADEGLRRGELEIQAKFALDDIARAVARDESDADLWRRAARVGAVLGSRRITRYCLEAAVEVDDDPAIAEVDPAGPEEAFAGEQLTEQLKLLEDEVALSHPIMGPYQEKAVASSLLKYMDPYPSLPNRTETLVDTRSIADRDEADQTRSIIQLPDYSWTAVGEALFLANLAPQGNFGAGIFIEMPPGMVEEPAEIAAAIQDQLMQDVAVESAVAEIDTTAASSATKPEEEAVQIVTTTTTIPLQGHDSTVSLPTRKRSHSEAGIRDTPEDDGTSHKRSKRIKNRDNTNDSIDPTTQHAAEIEKLCKADSQVFEIVGHHLAQLGVHDLGTFEELKEALLREEPQDRVEALANTPVRDLRDILRTWDDAKASTFQNGNAADILGSSTGGANAGLAAFLEHSKLGPQKLSNKPLFSLSDGLSPFTQAVNTQFMPIQDALYEWVSYILSTYRGTLWPDDLKVSLVRVVSFADADLFERLKFDIHRLQVDLTSSSLSENDLDETKKLLATLEESAQTLFELHLDVYSRITNPNSIVPFETRIMTKERLDRWADYAAECMAASSRDPLDELPLRYLWASVFYATMSDAVSREHKILCWSDLQTLLREGGDPTIELQNNAVMPELSVAAADREVSSLTTLDFFYKLFQADSPDPAAIVETLEPVLDPESACPNNASEESVYIDAVDNTSAILRDMWKFLKAGSTSLRLFLWQRLREAYLSIGYSTKVFSCHLKCIEIIVNDLQTEDYADSGEEPRRHKLLMWIKALDDLLVKSLTIALNDASTCFEIIDDRHLQSTCSALARLSRVLHAAALFDDEIRLGQTTLPSLPMFAAEGSFKSFSNKLREMEVRCWSLQFTLLKEAMSQNLGIFSAGDRDVANYLAANHYMLGNRRYCKSSNRIFLKMMKVEILRLKDRTTWEDCLEQIMYDLYDVRFGSGTYFLQEHGCPSELLDRRTVLNIAGYVIKVAQAMPMKDLMKHELKSTIEKMQQTVGPVKSTPQMQHNLRNYTEYLKTSIRPLHLYQAYRGQVQLDSLPVVTSDSPLTDNGWYFLLGMMALTKFRSQKRLGPGATDDLKVAATFLRLQLQYSAEDWEVWYRLAQCFDYELEEEVMWSADKLNNQIEDMNRLQRGSIHCYIMALSTATRNADDRPETVNNLSNMYFDFGMRMYASSREPFCMKAMWVDGFEKHFSGSEGMYKKALHEEMTRFKVWRYASTLFRRSLLARPKQWMAHFMLGKSLWKMYCRADSEDDPRDQARKPSKESVLEEFLQAVELAPKPRDSKSENVLEPHYKLVSVVHKMVLRSDLSPQSGADLLQQQQFGIQKGATVNVATHEEWEPFVLESLRHLRNADKQHWHHRMVARVINILYTIQHPDYQRAAEAQQEFRESIFTKTMQVQVWKPEFERPGRHFVYMERYVKLMASLMLLLNDKASMEQLTRRVKKKASDFFRFEDVWKACCAAYLTLIRNSASIPPNMDEVFKGVSHDDFELFSERLNAWIVSPAMDHPVLDALREAVELKKLNASLMKLLPIDDLISDIWATLYLQVTKNIQAPDSTLQLAQIDGEPHERADDPMSMSAVVDPGTTATLPIVPAPVEPPRPRKSGIRRKEVLRRAEQAVNRMVEASGKVNSASRTKLAEPASILPSNGPSNSRNAATPRVELPSQPHEEAKEESPEPTSVHDSADDESALSDLGRSPSLAPSSAHSDDLNEAETALLYPGLAKEESPGAERCDSQETIDETPVD